MPELHKLTPALGALLDQGFKVALITDGRMSGASGKVPAAIHLWPEAAAGGLIGRLRHGDPLLLDCDAGVLEAQVDRVELAQRDAPLPPPAADSTGRGLFALFRRNVGPAESGACALQSDD